MKINEQIMKNNEKQWKTMKNNKKIAHDLFFLI